MDGKLSARSEFAEAVDTALRGLRSPTATRGLFDRRADLMAAGAALLEAERQRIRVLVGYHAATLKDMITEETS